MHHFRKKTGFIESLAIVFGFLCLEHSFASEIAVDILLASERSQAMTALRPHLANLSSSSGPLLASLTGSKGRKCGGWLKPIREWRQQRRFLREMRQRVRIVRDLLGLGDFPNLLSGIRNRLSPILGMSRRNIFLFSMLLEDLVSRTGSITRYQREVMDYYLENLVREGQGAPESWAVIGIFYGGLIRYMPKWEINKILLENWAKESSDGWVISVHMRDGFTTAWQYLTRYPYLLEGPEGRSFEDSKTMLELLRKYLSAEKAPQNWATSLRDRLNE